VDPGEGVVGGGMGTTHGENLDPRKKETRKREGRKKRGGGKVAEHGKKKTSRTVRKKKH